MRYTVVIGNGRREARKGLRFGRAKEMWNRARNG